MSSKTLLTQFGPEDFATDRNYWNTFDNSETEVSARWVVMFLQDRGKGWDDFTVGEVLTFYGDEREKSNKGDDGFTFNRLIAGTHRHMTAQSFPSGELRDNNATITIRDENAKDAGFSPSNEAVCSITEAFVQALVKGKLHHAK